MRCNIQIKSRSRLLDNLNMNVSIANLLTNLMNVHPFKFEGCKFFLFENIFKKSPHNILVRFQNSGPRVWFLCRATLVHSPFFCENLAFVQIKCKWHCQQRNRGWNIFTNKDLSWCSNDSLGPTQTHLSSAKWMQDLSFPPQLSS